MTLTLLRNERGADPLVLIVDDHATIRRAIARIWCGRHARVCLRWEQAASAEEAISLLERAQELPAAVVSDERMPGMHGTDLLHLVGERWPGVGRMLLSAWSYGDQVLSSPWPVVGKEQPAERVVEAVCRLARAPRT